MNKRRLRRWLQLVLWGLGAWLLLKTGLSVTVAIRLDSAAFHNTAASATEIGTTGWYSVDLGTADTNGNVIAFSATAAVSVPTCMTIVTQA